MKPFAIAALKWRNGPTEIGNLLKPLGMGPVWQTMVKCSKCAPASRPALLRRA